MTTGRGDEATSVQNAESDADELLFAVWWQDQLKTRPLPVDPFRIASQLGIVVQSEALPSDESGRLVIPLNDSPVITLNRYDSDNRRRFTCAHEIGHYIDRRNQGLVDGHRDSEFVDYRKTLAGLGVDAREIYANQFGAALLMPKEALEIAYLGERLTVAQCARRFATSEQALELRLRNLGVPTR